MNKFTSLAVLSAAWLGCASAPVTSDRVASTEAPIRAAEEMGAAKVPQAQLELQYARDQTAQAKLLLQGGEKEKADRLLLRAQADAELALALAKEAPLAAQAKTAADEVRVLQQTNQTRTP